jgi:hypothetical protein
MSGKYACTWHCQNDINRYMDIVSLYLSLQGYRLSCKAAETHISIRVSVHDYITVVDPYNSSCRSF